jgi:hypothetical protein
MFVANYIQMGLFLATNITGEKGAILYVFFVDFTH